MYSLLLRVLPLALLLAACFVALPSAAQPTSGTFRGWHVGDVTPAGDVVYVLDTPSYIRALNRATGAVLPMNASLNRDDWVTAIAHDASTNRVYALVQASKYDWQNAYIDYYMVTLSSDLHIISNMSLTTLSPRPTYYERLFSRTLPVDKAGNVYLPRQLDNGTVLVHVIAPDSNKVATWQAPFPIDEYLTYSLDMGPDDNLYFQTNYYYYWYRDTEQRPLYVTTSSGALVSTLNLNLSSQTCAYANALAVSRVSGMIAVDCDNSIRLFDKGGLPIPSFRYFSVADTWSSFISLAFDSTDRLLGVVSSGDFGIQVISTTSGDLLADWSGRVPSLEYSQAIKYQPSTRSVLAFDSISDRSTVAVRIDADTGALMQQYRLLGRLDNCYTLARDVSASGDIHLLLYCYYVVDNFFYETKIVLHSLTPAGRVRREVVLDRWSLNMIMGNQLVVCEDKGMFYTVTNDYWYQQNQVVAFAFNGTNMFNFTDPRIGGIGYYRTGLLRADDNTIAVVDPEHSRIALLDLDDGAFFGNISVSRNNTQLLAAVYDGQSWFRSETTWSNDYQWVNTSVNQYSTEGDVLARYSLATQHQFSRLSVGSAGDGNRLYALDEYEGTMAWWQVQAQPIGQQIAPAKRHSTRGSARLQPAQQPHHDERFEAIVQGRRQQWMDEQKKQREQMVPAKFRHMRNKATTAADK